MLGAIDKLKNICRETFDEKKAIKGENSVFWYCSRKQNSKSFGFSDAENIKLYNPDELDGEKRLSWYLTANIGCYRIGNLKDLHRSKDYRKKIWILE